MKQVCNNKCSAQVSVDASIRVHDQIDHLKLLFQTFCLPNKTSFSEKVQLVIDKAILRSLDLLAECYLRKEKGRESSENHIFSKIFEKWFHVMIFVLNIK